MTKTKNKRLLAIASMALLSVFGTTIAQGHDGPAHVISGDLYGGGGFTHMRIDAADLGSIQQGVISVQTNFNGPSRSANIDCLEIVRNVAGHEVFAAGWISGSYERLYVEIFVWNEGWVDAAASTSPSWSGPCSADLNETNVMWNGQFLF